MSAKKERKIINGYYYAYPPDSRPGYSGRMIQEHILVMEKMTGRFKKAGEQIHHKDGNKLNNKPSNLYLCEDAEEHAYVENETRRLLRSFLRKKKLSKELSRFLNKKLYRFIDKGKKQH